MKLIQAIKKEISRSATGTFDAIFLNMLRKDYEDRCFDTDRVKKVREKYGI